MFTRHDNPAAAARLRSVFSLKRAACAAALALVVAAAPAAAGPTLVIDAESGKVLHAVDAFEPWYPASLTKMMTAYIVLEAMERGETTPSTPISITKAAMAEPPSKLGLPLGTGVEIQHALAVLMVKSANDIAVALAEAVAGSAAEFVQRMNRTAQRLGMRDTRFINPHGLPGEGQQTTARDMAVLARALIHKTYPPGHKLHDLREHLFHLHAVTLDKRRMNNTNGLVGRYPGTTGMKTGFTCASGYNVVASAKRNGRELIAVVLGARSGGQRSLIAASLLEQTFDQPYDLYAQTIDRLAPDAQPQLAPPDLRPIVCRPRKKKMTAEELQAFNAVHPSIDLERGRQAMGGKVAAHHINNEAPGAGDAEGDGDASGLVVAIKIYPPNVPATSVVNVSPPERRPSRKLRKGRKPAVANSASPRDLRSVGESAKPRRRDEPTGAVGRNGR